MKTVASRDLRNHTSGVLAEVAAGATVAITVHGRVVAELTPPSDSRPRAIPRDRLAALLASRRPDPGLGELLEELSADTTDDL